MNVSGSSKAKGIVLGILVESVLLIFEPSLRARVCVSARVCKEVHVSVCVGIVFVSVSCLFYVRLIVYLLETMIRTNIFSFSINVYKCRK